MSFLTGSLIFPVGQAFGFLPGIFKPFAGTWNFLFFGLFVLALIVTISSLQYFISGRFFSGFLKTTEIDVASEPEDKTGRITITAIVWCFGFLISLIVYMITSKALHSITIEPGGAVIDWTSKNLIYAQYFIEPLLAIGIIGTILGWTGVYQILLSDEIVVRYRKLIRFIPYLSFFMILSLFAGTWYFYLFIFPLWWYLVSFGFIYSAVYLLSLNDFGKKINSYITGRSEREMTLTQKTVSVLIGVILITLIIIPHILFGSMPASYMIYPYLMLLVVTVYMVPGRIMRSLSVIPRYASPSARILSFIKFTRKYMIAWLLIFVVLGGLLGARIILDPGFREPASDAKKCEYNLRMIGESLENYMEDNNDALPDTKSWTSGKWLDKIHKNKIKSIPTCPAGGKYIYKKWRSYNNSPLFEIRCSCGAHNRAGIYGCYPRYNRYTGILKKDMKIEKKN